MLGCIDAWHDDASGSCQSNRQSRPWRGRPRRCSSCPSRLRSVWPKEASPASKSTSEVTLVALYDVGIHVAVLAHGALPALLAVADGQLSRLAAHGGCSYIHMVDGPSSLGEVVMLGAGSIEHRELIYYTVVSKSTTFHPPRSGPGLMAARFRSAVS